MRRLIAIAATLVFTIGIPSGAALAAKPQMTDGPGDSPPVVQGAGPACDVKVSIHGGPLSDGPATIRLGQDLGVFGTGFEAATQVILEFDDGQGVAAFETTTSATGTFEAWFYFGAEEPASPVPWTLFVYDPLSPGSCNDVVQLTLIKSTPFTDIDGNPFRASIIFLYHEGITGGCASTLFCPKDAVTREQMASFLDRLLKLPPTNVDFFTDDSSSIHHGAINRLAAAGITGGCAAGRFCPKDPVFRDQMASFLDRVMGLDPTNQNFFTDIATNTHRHAINRLAAAGITGGCNASVGWYCPKLTVTREQMAAFIHRALTR